MGDELDHALGGGVRAVRRAERVVHVDVAERRQFLRERRVVLLFLGMEAQVLEQQHLAGRRLHGFHFGADAIGRHLDRRPSSSCSRAATGCRLISGFGFSLGTPQVRRQDDTGAVFQRVLDGGQRRLDALVAGDFHVALVVLLQRHIEIHADEDSFPFQVEIANREIRHIGPQME